jgi:branched-chain amino acid transport system ATP-binding protein
MSLQAVRPWARLSSGEQSGSREAFRDDGPAAKPGIDDFGRRPRFPRPGKAGPPVVLTLRSVAAGYGSFQALFDVSLDVQGGEAVAVIGPNGAGKTTLLRVISKLIEVGGGEIQMNDRLLNDVPAHQVIELGIAHVPENRRLFPRLTVEENLRIGAFTRAARAHFAERLVFVYELFPRLRERREQMAGTLSGGEQQMCAIGRGVMSGPKLLLLDEPSAGLAPVVVQQVFDLVRRLRVEGYTVLIVEQNVQQVLRVVDRAYLLETGQIKAAGGASELLASDDIRRAYIGL